MEQKSEYNNELTLIKSVRCAMLKNKNIKINCYNLLNLRIGYYKKMKTERNHFSKIALDYQSK